MPHTYHPGAYSPKSRPAQFKAFSKTTVARQPFDGHSALDADESSSPLDTPAPRARAPRPTINNSDLEIMAAKSPGRLKSRSPARSRSPGRTKSRSPGRTKSRSPKRSKSRSPKRDRQGKTSDD